MTRKGPSFYNGHGPSKKTTFVWLVKGSTFLSLFLELEKCNLAFVTCHEAMDAVGQKEQNALLASHNGEKNIDDVS